MDRSANVTSIDAIRDLRAAVLKFEEESREGVTMLVLEARRAMDWLDNDRRRYWPEQVRRASQKLTEARNDLERCQLKYGSEEAPSCYEQKKAFERAKRRLRLCEDKVRVVKRWIRAVRQELNEFDGQIAKTTSCLDSDIPRAVAILERMLRALDNYAVTGSPTSRTPAPATDDATHSDSASESTSADDDRESQ